MISRARQREPWMDYEYGYGKLGPKTVTAPCPPARASPSGFAAFRLQSRSSPCASCVVSYSAGRGGFARKLFFVGICDAHACCFRD